MHYCKDPLWGWRLGLDFLDLTPQFAHWPLLLLNLITVKKKSQGCRGIVPDGGLARSQ